MMKYNTDFTLNTKIHIKKWKQKQSYNVYRPLIDDLSYQITKSPKNSKS